MSYRHKTDTIVLATLLCIEQATLYISSTTSTGVTLFGYIIYCATDSAGQLDDKPHDQIR